MAEIYRFSKPNCRKKMNAREKKIKSGSSFEVRDHREREWFYIDNLFIEYLKVLGTSTSCVYMCLSRHSGADQTCFPSIDLIADELGISKRTVIRGLQALEAHKMIKAYREKGRHNYYGLLNRRYWRKTVPVVSEKLREQVAFLNEIVDACKT